MLNTQNVVTKQESLDISDLVRRIKAADIGVSGVFLLVDADDAEIRFAVVDESIPGGGYIKGFPLMTGQTYLIAPVDMEISGVERGINVPPKDS